MKKHWIKCRYCANGLKTALGLFVLTALMVLALWFYDWLRS